MPRARLRQGLTGGAGEDGRATLKLVGAIVEIDNAQIDTEERLDGCGGAVGDVGRTISALLQHYQPPLAYLPGQVEQQAGDGAKAGHRHAHLSQWIKPTRVLAGRDED